MFRGVLLLMGIVLLGSCNTNIVQSEFKAIGSGYWNKDNVVEFEFANQDTLNAHDVFVNIRNDQNYQYSNLFLIAEMNFPNGNKTMDTLEFEMARPDGTWLGKGYGSVKENKLWYKENVIFPSSGVYTLKVSHAMRKNGDINGVINLEGITDVGFELVKSNK